MMKYLNKKQNTVLNVAIVMLAISAIFLSWTPWWLVTLVPFYIVTSVLISKAFIKHLDMTKQVWSIYFIVMAAILILASCAFGFGLMFNFK